MVWADSHCIPIMSWCMTLPSNATLHARLPHRHTGSHDYRAEGRSYHSPTAFCCPRPANFFVAPRRLQHTTAFFSPYMPPPLPRLTSVPTPPHITAPLPAFPIRGRRRHAPPRVPPAVRTTMLSPPALGTTSFRRHCRTVVTTV